jgi:hypothetical protein
MKLWFPQITSFTSITDINLRREMVAVNYRNRAKPICGLRRQIAKYFNVIAIFKLGYHWALEV